MSVRNNLPKQEMLVESLLERTNNPFFVLDNLLSVLHKNSLAVQRRDLTEMKIKQVLDIASFSVAAKYDSEKKIIPHSGEFWEVEQRYSSTQKDIYYLLEIKPASNKDEQINYLKNILALVPGHVYWKNCDGVLLGCNNEMAKFIGVSSPRDLVGTTEFDVQDYEDAENIRELDEKVMASGITHVQEEPFKTKNGKEAIFLSTKVPLKNNQDEVIGILGISSDITELKKLEDKLKQAVAQSDSANNEKTEFIAVLNNILRSKVNTIAMMSDLLKTTELSKKQRECLHLLQAANSEIPEELVYAADYAKLDSGELELFPEEFYLIDMVESQVNTFYRQAAAQDLSFAVDYMNLPGVCLKNSVTQLREIVKVIIMHSIEYTGEGGINQYFSVESNEQGHWVTIHIRDSSAGFQQDFIDNMFSLSDANKTQTEYPKLIMRMVFCKKMLDEMGGTLAVVNNKEGGNTFSITLPIIRVDPLQEEEKPFVSAALAYRYVLIDDDAMRIASVRSLLDDTALRIFSPQRAVKNIKAIITKGDDLDMIFLDTQLLVQQSQLLDSVLQAIAGKDKLVILLTDENTTQLPELHNAASIAMIAKPLKWSRFYRDILNHWSEYNQPRLRVLSVEDDPICQKGLEFVLQEFACDVTTVGSGEKALAALEETHAFQENHQFDVIFLDIGLPGQSGLATAEVIAQRLDDGTCPRLIALTGLTRKVDLDILYDSGLFYAVLEKPATIKDVEDVLTRIKY